MRKKKKPFMIYFARVIGILLFVSMFLLNYSIYFDAFTKHVRWAITGTVIGAVLLIKAIEAVCKEVNRIESKSVESELSIAQVICFPMRICFIILFFI